MKITRFYPYRTAYCYILRTWHTNDRHVKDREKSLTAMMF